MFILLLLIGQLCADLHFPLREGLWTSSQILYPPIQAGGEGSDLPLLSALLPWGSGRKVGGFGFVCFYSFAAVVGLLSAPNTQVEETCIGIYFSNLAWNPGASHQLVILASSPQQHCQPLSLTHLQSGQKEDNHGLGTVLAVRRMGERYLLLWLCLGSGYSHIPISFCPSGKENKKTLGGFSASVETLQGSVGDSALVRFL